MSTPEPLDVALAAAVALADQCVSTLNGADARMLSEEYRAGRLSVRVVLDLDSHAAVVQVSHPTFEGGDTWRQLGTLTKTTAGGAGH